MYAYVWSSMLPLPVAVRPAPQPAHPSDAELHATRRRGVYSGHEPTGLPGGSAAWAALAFVRILPRVFQLRRAHERRAREVAGAAADAASPRPLP